MNKKGFTIVELLAVIVIIGIIALIGTVSINAVKDNINKNMEVTKIKFVLEAAKTYGQDNRYEIFADISGTKEMTASYLKSLNYLEDGDITNIENINMKIYLENDRVNVCILSGIDDTLPGISDYMC